MGFLYYSVANRMGRPHNIIWLGGLTKMIIGS